MAKLKDGYFKNIGSAEGNDSYALLAGGGHLSYSNSGGANALVQRNANGYIVNNYFSTIGGGSEKNASGLGYIAGFNTSDYYIRSYTSAAVKSWLGLGSNAYTSTAYLPLSGGTMTGNTVVNNYGIGNVGLYSATRYQNIFSMGAAYTPLANGTGLSNMYGIAWTHPNVGGQSKAGLSHQALFVEAGVTKTAIGTGIWTAGNVTAPTFIGALSGNASTASSTPLVTSKGNLTAETLRNVHATGIYTFNVRNNTLGDFTPSQYWTVLAWGRGASGSAELAASWTSNGNELLFRSLRDTADNWYAWKEILHSANYTTYTVSKTGGGASGTWGINISGNSAKSTGLLSEYSLGTDFNSTSINRNGLFWWSNNAVNRPYEYGVLFQMSNITSPKNGSSSHWVNQLAWGTADRIYVRQRINADNWTSWKTLAYITDNVSSATKLATARTIWGQSFNGSANVSGALTGVSTISASGNITTSSGFINTKYSADAILLAGGGTTTFSGLYKHCCTFSMGVGSNVLATGLFTSCTLSLVYYNNQTMPYYDYEDATELTLTFSVPASLPTLNETTIRNGTYKIDVTSYRTIENGFENRAWCINSIGTNSVKIILSGTSSINSTEGFIVSVTKRM